MNGQTKGFILDYLEERNLINEREDVLIFETEEEALRSFYFEDLSSDMVNWSILTLMDYLLNPEEVESGNTMVEQILIDHHDVLKVDIQGNTYYIA